MMVFVSSRLNCSKSSMQQNVRLPTLIANRLKRINKVKRFCYACARQAFGKYFSGNRIFNASIRTHKIDSSSTNWPALDEIKREQHLYSFLFSCFFVVVVFVVILNSLKIEATLPELKSNENTLSQRQR